MTVPDTLAIGFGYLSKRNPHYDMPVKCYICDTPHMARCAASIYHEEGTTDVPLCGPCCHAGGTARMQAVLRKFFDSSDLDVDEDGLVSAEEFAALIEKRSATEQ